MTRKQKTHARTKAQEKPLVLRQGAFVICDYRRESMVGLVAIATAAIAATAATAAAVSTTAAAAATAAATTTTTESAATATAAATTTVATTATAAATLFARTSFVNGESATTVLVAVERLNGGFSLGIIGHFDKSEAFASAGVAVIDDLCGNDLSVCREQSLEFRAVNRVAQVPDIQLLTHWKSPVEWVSTARVFERFFPGQNRKRLTYQPGDVRHRRRKEETLTQYS
jgi:hypothetical protein